MRMSVTYPFQWELRPSIHIRLYVLLATIYKGVDE